jgi:hypothetical protein
MSNLSPEAVGFPWNSGPYQDATTTAGSGRVSSREEAHAERNSSEKITPQTIGFLSAFSILWDATRGKVETREFSASRLLRDFLNHVKS